MAENQLGFYINLSACSGCKACQVSCKDKNDTPVGVLWRRVYEISGGNYLERGDALIDNTFTYNLSSACSHCNDPACLKVCPTEAIWKREDDGIVIIDGDKCIGCRYCEWACPYGAPQFDAEKHIMTKCDFCYDYVDAGQKPACVSACQMRVLEFGPIDELREQYGEAGQFFPFPDPSITDPNTTFTPHKDVVLADEDNAFVGNPEEV